MPPDVSVVIPIYRESPELLDELIAWIKDNTAPQIEWILSIAREEETLDLLRNSVFHNSNIDTAQTPQLIDKGKSIYMISAERGRARQMNLAAQHANGEVLAFLHADTRPDFNGLDKLTGNSKEVIWGCFKPAIDEKGVLFRLAELFGILRTKLLAIPYGDQCIFVHKTVFQSVGGYDETVEFMEDLQLSRTLTRKYGRPAIMSEKAVTSSRLWNRKKGLIEPLKQSIKNFIAFVLFQAGISREKIQNWYQR